MPALRTWLSTLLVAAFAAASAAHPASAQVRRTHVIQRGETLYRIARSYGVRVDDLMRRNHIVDPSQVRAGTVLELPEPPGSAPGRSAAVSTAEITLQGAAVPVIRGGLPSDAWDTAPVHVVRSGDNLYRIALRYGVTVQALRHANGLAEDVIVVGQALRLPEGYRDGANGAPPAPPSPPSPPDPTISNGGFTAAERAAVPRGISSDRQSVVQEALSLLGTPYVWGGTNRLAGLDCSGFITVLFERRVPVPRVSYDQWRAGAPVRPEEWAAGDLIFFNIDGTGASHVGMLIGGDKFIHSSSAGRGVIISSFNAPFYRRAFLGARRLLP
jgi:cell wall-associated NlpC family hydrolase